MLGVSERCQNYQNGTVSNQLRLTGGILLVVTLNLLMYDRGGIDEHCTQFTPYSLIMSLYKPTTTLLKWKVQIRHDLYTFMHRRRSNKDTNP
jgi:hypothetical protein